MIRAHRQSCFSSRAGWDPHIERHSIFFSCTGVLRWFSSCKEWVKSWLSLRIFRCKSHFYTQGLCVSLLTDLWPCICFPLCFVVWCKFPHAQTVWGRFPMIVSRAHWLRCGTVVFPAFCWLWCPTVFWGRYGFLVSRCPSSTMSLFGLCKLPSHYLEGWCVLWAVDVQSVG